MSNWKEYKNGNYTVSINLDNGTKIRENDLDNLTPAFAENCDVTVSTVCDGGCKWCYMDCTSDGRHGDIMNPKFLDTLHEWTELAINGNDLTHPDLIPFLEKMKKKNIIVNMTVNQKHFEAKQDMIKKLYSAKLINGLGVSLVKPTYEFIKLIKQYPNAVIHTIVGITEINDYRYSYKKTWDLSRNGTREEFENLYPGYIYTTHEVQVNEINAGTYIYIKMRKIE